MIENNKSQVTIFVLIAIFIVASIAIFFAVRTPSGPETVSAFDNPARYMQNCMKPAVEEAVQAITPSGGFKNPSNYFRFNNTNVAFVCYIPNYEKLCINSRPMLNRDIESQIAEIIRPQISKCLNDIKTSLSQYNYKEETSSFELAVEIKPAHIAVNINKKITYTVNGQTVSLNSFGTAVNSPMFSFIKLENMIINEELDCNCGAESCDSDFVKISMDNPDFEVEHFLAGTGEEVYTVREVLSGKEFNFAMRNCVRRPYGYGGLL